MTARDRILATILSRAVEGRWTGRLADLARELEVNYGWVKEVVAMATDVGALERCGTDLVVHPEAARLIEELGRGRASWPDEVRAEMRRLWAEGVSISEIGARLGYGKNAVGGMARRDPTLAPRGDMSNLPWPASNIPLLREDAGLGLSANQCAAKRRLNPSTVRKYAGLHGIVFAPEPPRARPVAAEAREESAYLLAAGCLAREIAAAKREAGVVPVWRGGWE